MPNPCIEKFFPELSSRHQQLVKEGLSDREAAIKATLEEHQKVFTDLQNFRKGLKLPQENYVPFDNKDAVKKINDKYNPLIEEKKNANVEVPLPKKEGTGSEVEPIIEVTKKDILSAQSRYDIANKKLKKAEDKIAKTQSSQQGMFGGEQQKGMFAMGREEAVKALKPLRDEVKNAKTALDEINKKFEVQGNSENPTIFKEEKLFTKNELARTDAKEIYRQVREVTDEPIDADQIALKYIADGGKVGEDVINEISGTAQRAKLNTGAKENKSSEVKARDYSSKTNETLDDIAHSLWEQSNQEISERDIKDSLMDVINTHNTRLSAGQEYLERYSPEYAEKQQYEKFLKENEEAIAQEENDIKEWLQSEGEKEFELMADENYVTNLINQYEQQTKGENKQSPSKTESGTNKENGSNASNGKTEKVNIPDAEQSKTDKVLNAKEAGDNANEPPNKDSQTSEGNENSKAEGIKYEATDATREQLGLAEREPTETSTDAEKIAAAREIIKNDPYAVRKVIDKIQSGGKVEPMDNAVLAVYKKTLDIEFEKNPSQENYNKQLELIKVLEPSGADAGKLLQSRKLVDYDEDSLANHIIMETAVNNGKPLSPEQLKEQAAVYAELKQAKEDLAKAQAEIAEKDAQLISQIGLNKAKAQRKRESKKSNEEYKVERKSIVEEAKQKIIEAREAAKNLSTRGVSTRTKIDDLTTIAPQIKKYLQSLVNEGADKLDNIVTAIHAEFKDVLDGITKKDISDIIAGEYDVKQPTRNEKAAKIRLLQREASLLNSIAKARKGIKETKLKRIAEKENRRIAELEKQLKELEKINKEVLPESEYDNDAAISKKQDALLTKIKKLEQDIKDKKYGEEKKEPVPLAMDRKTSAMMNKVIELEYDIMQKRLKAEYDRKPEWEKNMDKVQQVLGVRRLMQSSMDFSVWFRQGASMISTTNGKLWLRSAKQSIASVRSPQKYNQLMYAIRNSPNYHEMVKDGVVFNDFNSLKDGQRNEDFQQSFLYKIPILKEPLLASQRNADGFLNTARYELYNKFRSKLEKEGITRQSDPIAYQEAAKLAMNMTGRGNLLKAFENEGMQKVLGQTFYGARLMASRINLLNPAYYAKLYKKNPVIAKQAMKDLASSFATMVTVGTALAAAGGNISLNPDDSDFLQVRFGKKVYDLSGGMSVYLRTYGRIIKAGFTKATKNKYEGTKATQKSAESLGKALRNKLSPNTGYIADMFLGKQGGKEFDATDVLKAYPMYIDEAAKALETDGVVSLATVLAPNVLGVGYGNYATKGTIDSDLDTLLERNTRTDEQDFSNLTNKKDGTPATKEQINKYIKLRDAYITKEIIQLYNKGLVIYDKKQNKAVLTPFKDIPSDNSDEIIKETSAIKAKATTLAKKEIFGEKSDIEKINESTRRLNIIEEKLKQGIKPSDIKEIQQEEDEKASELLNKENNK